MIEIATLGVMPFKQEPTSQKMASVSQCMIYTDGKNKYVICTFSNDFSEAFYDLSFELTQLDEENNALVTEKYVAGILFCKTKCAVDQKDPIKINDKCASVYVKLLSVTFSTAVWKDDVFINPFAMKKSKKVRLPTGKMKIKEYSYRVPISTQVWLVAFLIIISIVILTVIVSLSEGSILLKVLIGG